jgi:hypothetical protein
MARETKVSRTIDRHDPDAAEITISSDNHTKHRFRAIKKYNLMRGSSAIASSLVRRGEAG